MSPLSIIRSCAVPSFNTLPSYNRYAGLKGTPFHFSKHKKFVLKTVEELDIPIIDIDIYFKKSSDPLIFFPFRGYGHYNAKGYNYITDVIMNRINDK